MVGIAAADVVAGSADVVAAVVAVVAAVVAVREPSSPAAGALCPAYTEYDTVQLVQLPIVVAPPDAL